MDPHNHSVKRRRKIKTQLSDLKESSIKCNNIQTHIDAISDKELFFIFDILPLADLMNLELVSRRWRWIQTLVCRSKNSLVLYRKKHFLSLQPDITRYWFMTDHHSTMSFKEGSLQVASKVSVASVRAITLRFPKVASLSLYGVPLGAKQFTILTTHWPSLKSLTYFLDKKKAASLFQTQSFRRALNSLKFLNHLVLPVDFASIDAMEPMSQIIDQLSSFFVKGRFAADIENIDIDDINFDAEIEMGIDRLVLNITDPEYSPDNIVLYSERGPSQNLRITRVSFRWDALNPRADPDFFGFLSSTVTHLDCSLIDGVDLTGLLGHFPFFPSLTHLRLACQPNGDIFRGLTRRNCRNKMPPMEKVKHLHLSGIQLTNGAVFTYINCIFPNIESLHIEDCSLTKNYRWLWKALGKFSKLKNIYHNNQFVLQLDRSSSKEIRVHQSGVLRQFMYRERV